MIARNLAAPMLTLAQKGARLAFHLLAERCRRNAMRALQRIDDRMLADLGVPRGAFELALSAPAA
jgi:uncharacterized protein YjiS (DUF1127 family)